LQQNDDKINQELNAKPLHHRRKAAFMHALLPEQKHSGKNPCRMMVVCSDQNPTGFHRARLHSCQHWLQYAEQALLAENKKKGI